jgi:regulator of microtubule dynamics protein 3
MRIASSPVAWCAALPVLILLLAPPALSQSGQGRSDELLGRAAESYAHGDLKGARGNALEALNASPGRFTVLHRLARIESMLAEDTSGEDGRRLVAAAVEHAREAVKTAPDSAAGHLELAVALGRQALKEGPKTQLSLSREIKSEVDRTLALNPAQGRAWHVLALWNRKLAGLNFMERTVAKTVLGGVPKGASMDNAVADMQKAIELEPAYVNHRLEQGRTFIQLKRKSDARRELERAVALPPSGSPLDPKYQAEARELLTRLKKN